MNIDKPKGKSVLIFSGGLDSLIASRLAKPDILLNVDIGTTASKWEYRCLAQLQELGAIPAVQIADLHGLGRYEREDHVLPMRNLFLLAIASMYGEHLMLGTVEGDLVGDQSPQFFRKAETIFSILYDKQWWCQPRPFVITTPLATRTKTECVRDYLADGGSKESLAKSWSCYKFGHGVRHCGHCPACVRKWVALDNNGIDTTNYFIHPPWTSPILTKELLAKVGQGTSRGREDVDWVQALEKHIEL